MSKTLTFRGVLPDGIEKEINLKTIKGKVGYIIKKFQIISQDPGHDTNGTCELVCKINKKSVAVDQTIEFDDSNLLAVCYFQNVPVHNSSAGQSPTQIIIFDNEVFNQNIFVQSTDVSGNTNTTNFYIELETIALTDTQSTQLTLKSLKTLASR